MSNFDDLKSRIDISTVIRQSGIELKQVGKNLMGQCPFHDDSTASLSVNGKLWNCFGCEAGGDVFTWLRLKEKIELPAAIERVRQMLGEPATTLNRHELLERVVDHYVRRFRETPQAQQYLNRRGLASRELWDAFRIGYCDGSLPVPEEGPVHQALSEWGVLNSKGKEAFRGCLVVPLTHPEQGLVGLYGRRLSSEAKVPHQYLSGPHRGILNWQGLRLSTTILVAESVLDALSLWQAGFPEATCLYGVQGLPQGFEEALSDAGVQEVVFCLDPDKAGREATQRYAARFSQRGLRCSTIDLPDDKDPNQILQERGAETLRRLGQQRQPITPQVSSQPAQLTASTDGFTLSFGAVRYQLWPQPPFTSRLRARIRAVRDHRMTMDVVDFYVSRSRKSFLNQLGSQLELPRIDAERHLVALMEHLERWAQQRQNELEQETEERPTAPELSEAEREQALQFLTQPNLVQAILDDMQEMGYVGEDNAKLLGYLISISRKLEKPLSGIVLSQSSAGKSSLTDLIEQLTPPEDVVLFSRLSPQALYWMERTALKRRLLILEERAGAIEADYSIRTLQSRHKLIQSTVIKDPVTGKLTAKTFVVEGPMAYLETTTNNRINYENATRCFEISLDESAEQTRRIQAWQRGNRLPSRRDRRKLQETIRTRHHNAQRLLEPVLVYIPYAEHLSFPSKWLRTRRDNERFLCLIEAITFLHQFQRHRGTTDDGAPYVMANLEDYRLAYHLAKDVLAITLHELSRDAKDLWDLIREWVAEQGEPSDIIFSRRDLRSVTGLEDHRLRQSLQELQEMEYIEAVSGSPGRAYQYRLRVGEDAHSPMMRDLTTPEELEHLWKQA